jgi:hypothetical protein
MPPSIGRLFLLASIGLGTSAWAAETKPFSIRDISPATPENVGAAARERMSVPAKPVTPDRIFQVGLGVGFPDLIAVEASLQLLKHWQVGATYGLLPGTGIIPNVSLPRATASLTNGIEFALDPVASTGLTVICPFVRYFPTTRPFYFQLTWGLLLSNHTIVSGLTELSTGTVIPESTITANIHLTTSIPTLSIGHIFWRRFFFFNVSLGATFLLDSTSTIAVTAKIPSIVGSLPAAQEAQIKQQLDAGLTSAVAAFREKVAILPSIMLSTGMMF